MLIKHFHELPDEEIERLIDELADCQKKVFDRVLVFGSGEDRRRALFIAKSYPINEDHRCYGDPGAP